MRMTNFIDLDRQFHALTDAELEDTVNLAALGDYGLGMGWPKLLEKHDRVILLAEAGAGKTAEMRQQARRLAEKGSFAFFVALESLDREPVEDVLSVDEAERLEEWKAGGHAPAWFFLDAVDELKLTQGKLDRALRRLSRALDGRLDRARIIISCRPNDWLPHVDADTVQDRLPAPVKNVGIRSEPPEQAFLDALRHESGRAASGDDDPVFQEDAATHDQQDVQSRNALRTVVMLPMSDRQIERFARQSGVRDAAAFLAEIRRQDAWVFARRPLDLTELITTWTRSGVLGTRLQQHETNVTAKLEDAPDRPDNGVLAEDCARSGAERLALALALTRTRTIRSPEQTLDIDRAEGVLDPARILSDWTEAERQALLRRALFDPATYGRVRFHHRSIQEYLAARRLRTLREQGMPIKSLLRLLFAEHYGVKVALPSMRAIAAWLALWNDDVRGELIEREPEALLNMGDPGSLDMTARAGLVRGFAATYGRGRSRHLDIPLTEVRRLAHPDLAPVIRECWNTGASNEDVRELLIEMIWQGRIESCADLARVVAFDDASEPYPRVIAIQALVVCDRRDDVAKLANAMLDESTGWPARVVHGVAADLFPRFITADQLVALMERTRESKRTVGGFEWVSQRIVEAIEPLSEPAFTLRDKLADLVRRGRATEIYNLHSRFGYLAPALATLCDRQMTATTGQPDADLVRATVIACRFSRFNRFSGLRGDNREHVAALRAHVVAADAMLRRDAFWADLAFADEVDPTDDAWRRLFNVVGGMRGGLVSHPTDADRSWLVEALADEGKPERRAVALHALIDIWWRNGRIDTDLDTIRASLKGDAVLGRILDQRTAPPKRNEERERIERNHRRRERAEAKREDERLKDCKEWRNALIADPADAFSAAKTETTLSDLYWWLRAANRRLDRYDVWDKDKLTYVFGADVATHAEDAFRALWRATRPDLWSARPAGERNHTPGNWIFGLMGVSAETATPRWAEALSSRDAAKAAIYATIERNGFAPFVTDLATSHPAEVAKVIGGEAAAELAMGDDHDHLPMLQKLEYADVALKRLCAPYLLAALHGWPPVVTDDAAGRWTRHLDQVLHVLNATGDTTERERIAEECVDRFKAAPTGPMALIWLKGLFRFDAVQGAETLIDAFENDAGTGASGIRGRAAETFATLFGDNRSIGFDVSDPDRRARFLGRLVRYAYAFIRPADDQVHEDVYSPNTRDHAERARKALLHWLLGTPGPETRRVLLEIADDDEFAEMCNYLRLCARKRAADDAEFPPYDPDAVGALEKRYKIPPNDRDGLFALLLDRLEDLAHDLAHDDFSDWRTVRSITKESEMQRTIASRLRDRTNGVYAVTREEEVADGNRTDIRLVAVGSDQKVAVEVKIADKGWSLKDLEDALRDQLAGRYLRHSNCAAGCLLLTYHGRKRHWIDPVTKERLAFHDVVSLLKEKAKAIEQEHQHRIRVAVFGLDLAGVQPASV